MINFFEYLLEKFFITYLNKKIKVNTLGKPIKINTCYQKNKHQITRSFINDTYTNQLMQKLHINCNCTIFEDSTENTPHTSRRHFDINEQIYI